MNSSLEKKRITLTRPIGQAGKMREMLEARGAKVIEFPTIQIQPVSNPEPLQEVLRQLHSFDRVLFTSVNGVESTWDHLSSPWPDSVRVAAIGPATARALHRRGIQPDFVPSEYVAEALASGLGSVQGERILLPRASRARPALAQLLRDGGATVKSVTAYETHLNQPSDAAYAALSIGTDIVTFTSGSTVEGFSAISPADCAPITAACIGPITAQVAVKAGFEVAVVAKTYTTEGLVTALEEHFGTLEPT